MIIDSAISDTNGGLNDQHDDEWDPEEETIFDSESDFEQEHQD